MKWAFVAGIGLLLAGTIGLIELLARRVHQGVFRVPPPADAQPYDLDISLVSDDVVTLNADNRGAYQTARSPGTYGLQYPGGYARLSDVLSEVPRSRCVERRFRTVMGDAPAVGMRGRVDSFAFPLDPRTAHDVEWKHLDLPFAGSQRPLPAWLVEGHRGRWAIFVHGKGASRAEALRTLPLLVREGWTSLAITYRNDAECDQTGCYTYGAVEWEELQAAVDFAREQGATDIVLLGYSMGGAIALNFLSRSPDAHLVRGLVLDAPMTDLRHLLHVRGRAMRVPRPILVAAAGRARRRASMAWEDVDYHRSFAANVPVLLFHGEADDVIPVALSDRFAAGRPNVTYHRVPGAGHVRSWNTDPARYEAAVSAFLSSLPTSPVSSAAGSSEGQPAE